MSIKQSSYSVKGYNLYPSMSWGYGCGSLLFPTRFQVECSLI